MKHKLRFRMILLAVFVVVCAGVICFAATPNTCVNCHTNESLMKAMYKPPVLPPSEGEG
jgi:hypothetical protein